MEYPHIILIVIDTLRRDYAKLLEDELKLLGFISYDNVIAPAPWTIPSYASILTGLYPLYHGAHETKTKKSLEIKLSQNEMLLTNKLKNNYAYSNYLISANPFISPKFGFEGFDRYFDIYPLQMSFFSPEEQLYIQNLLKKEKGKIHASLRLVWDKKFSLLSKVILSKVILTFFRNKFRKIELKLGIPTWPLDKGIKKALKIINRIEFNNSTFVFMSLMEVHDPYTLEEPPALKVLAENLKTNVLDNDFVKIWKERYPIEVKYIKRNLSRMFKKLKDIGVFDKSLIIITSDHGQLMGEHGRVNHGTFLYDELIRVPLFIKYPKNQEIEHEIPNELQYISLTRLKSYILSILNGEAISDRDLYDSVAFSESYGIPQIVAINEIKQSILTEEEKKNIEQLEKYRIAIYYKNFKAIFNVTDWKFEEIISYDPKIEVTEDVVKHMKKEVVKFLKTATVAKVPRTRF